MSIKNCSVSSVGNVIQNATHWPDISKCFTKSYGYTNGAKNTILWYFAPANPLSKNQNALKGTAWGDGNGNNFQSW
jgi:hypothetical protein